MSKVLATAILTLLWLASGVLPAIAEDIRVVSWNLQWFPGRSRDASPGAEAAQIQAVQRALVELQPDIICLQEIRDQAAAELALELLPGMKVAVFSRFRGDQQVVIATRYPVDSGWFADWERTGQDDPPRGYTFAAIHLPTEQPHLLMTYGFHFKSNFGDDTAARRQSNIIKREKASEQLRAHIREITSTYAERGRLSWLLAGDFNTSLDDRRFAGENTIRALQKAGFTWVFTGLPPTERFTLPASGQYPAVTFDHQLFRGLELVSVSVPTQYRAASDHRPILAVYRVARGR